MSRLMGFHRVKRGCLTTTLPTMPIVVGVLVFLLLQQNTMAKTQVEEEGVDMSAYMFITSGSQGSKSSRAGTWKQELVQESWRSIAYWLVSHGLLSLLSYRTQDHHPRDVPTHKGLVLPTSITNWSYSRAAGFEGGIFSAGGPSTMMTQTCVKMT